MRETKTSLHFRIPFFHIIFLSIIIVGKSCSKFDIVVML